MRAKGGWERGDGPPDAYLCPITKALMRDPVCTADGHTFERDAIAHWLAAAGQGAKLVESVLRRGTMRPPRSDPLRRAGGVPGGAKAWGAGGVRGSPCSAPPGCGGPHGR